MSSLRVVPVMVLYKLQCTYLLEEAVQQRGSQDETSKFSILEKMQPPAPKFSFRLYVYAQVLLSQKYPTLYVLVAIESAKLQSRFCTYIYIV